MNIRVDLSYAIKDGTEVVFRSPVDCSQVTGLKVYYTENGISASKEFAFADAHGNNVGDIDHLFAENVVVKVILDVTHAMAFVQNADTNAYIERTFVKTVNGIAPDANGNVVVEGGNGTGGVAVETDPTVPAWAKQPNKPTYTASEVGALPASTVIPTVPTKVSAFENDKGYLTDYTETDPTVPSWAKASSKPSYTKSEVGLGNVDNVKQYSASNPPPYPVTSVNGKTGAVSLTIPTVPTKVSAFTNDAGYLTQHQDISGKLDASALPTAIDTALAQAKASGEFDGEDGQRGTGLLSVTTAPSSHTTAVGGITPKYRMALSTIKTQAGVTEVLLGDTVRYSYYHYPIAYLDSSYAYFTTRVSIRGATGASVTIASVSESTEDGGNNVVTFSDDKTLTVKNGNAGYTPVRGTDYWTSADKAEIVASVIESLGGNPVFGVLDADNNIILSGLDDGTYTLKYENEDGTYTEIGELEVDEIPDPAPLFTNLVPTALDPNLTEVYNGVGYKANTNIDSTSKTEVTGKNCTLTGLIPFGVSGDVFHIRGVDVVKWISGRHSGYCHFYGIDGNCLSGSVTTEQCSTLGTDDNGDFTIAFRYTSSKVPDGAAYVRLNVGAVNGEFIITRNELIPLS